MKKIIAYLLTLSLLIAAAAACSEKKDTETISPDLAQTETSTADDTDEIAAATTETVTSEDNVSPEEQTPEPTADNSSDQTLEAATESAAPSSPERVTVTDMTGREVTIPADITRVIALTAGDCEIIYALGAGDLLVGRGEYCDWPPEVLDVTSVQSGYDTNIEQILSLDPQLIIMSTMAQSEEQNKQLADAGIAVIVSDAKDIAETYEAIELIGTALGRAAEAEDIISYMRTGFEELRGIFDGQGKTIYFEASPLTWGLWATDRHTFMNDIAEILGLTNVFGEIDEYAEVSEEQVLNANPDYIVTTGMYDGVQNPDEEIYARPNWDTVSAIANGGVLWLPNNEIVRPGPRLVEGARLLAEFIESH